MSLVLTEEQTLIRNTARSFFADRSPVKALRELRVARDGRGYDPTLWHAMAELGWPGIASAEEFGGVGLGYVELGLILEEGARVLAASPLFATTLCAATAITLCASGDQKSAWLPGIVSGKVLWGLAVEEAPAHRALPSGTIVTGRGGRLTLSGHKVLVFDGPIADKLLVAATFSSSSKAGIVAVDASADGVSIERRSVIDARNTGDARFEGVQITPAHVLGGEERSANYERVLDVLRIGAAAELLGISQEVFDRTLAYLKERKQFGEVIGQFQALQHRAAKWYCQVEVCRSVVLAALQTIDRGDEDLRRHASAAKAIASGCALASCGEAIQLHGGIGMTDELDLGLFLKRAQVLSQAFGGEDFHLNRLADLKGY